MSSPTPNEPTASERTGAAKERLALLPDDLFNADQRRVAEALRNGPRNGVVGPFIPLLYAPNLSERIEPLGSELRFFGTIDRRVHELMVCLVAATTRNQYEWAVHVPAALTLGVTEAQIQSLRVGEKPPDLRDDEECAYDFATSLMAHNEVADDVFERTLHHFDESGVVELTAIVGYFVMMCWFLNVAGTPAPRDSAVTPLPSS